MTSIYPEELVEKARALQRFMLHCAMIDRDDFEGLPVSEYRVIDRWWTDDPLNIEYAIQTDTDTRREIVYWRKRDTEGRWLLCRS